MGRNEEIVMRARLKQVFQLFGLLAALPFFILYRLSGKNNFFFVGIGQMLSLIPDKVGSFVRVGFYRMTLKRCPATAYIGFGSYFSKTETEVGEGVYISAHCLIGNVILKEHVGLSPGVQILSGKHQHSISEIGKPFLQQKGGGFQQIVIGENSWIGQNAIVMANIGRQNMIGAGSVVVRDSGDYEVLGGNPAKVIKRLDVPIT